MDQHRFYDGRQPVDNAVDMVEADFPLVAAASHRLHHAQFLGFTKAMAFNLFGLDDQTSAGEIRWVKHLSTGQTGIPRLGSG